MGPIKEKYFKGAKPCQYLYSSSLTLQSAIRLYNSTIPGDTEASFSDFHKAWDKLWQTDRLLNQNGNSFKVSTTNENYGKDKSGALEYGLTSLLRAVEQNPAESSVPSLDGYEHNKATGLFQELDDRRDPFFLNLNLFRHIRNSHQHANVNEAPAERYSIIVKMNPYVLANYNNYLTLYKSIREKVLKDCLSNHKHSIKSGHCFRNNLISSEHLAAQMSIPMMLSDFNSNLANSRLDAALQNLNLKLEQVQAPSFKADRIWTALNSISKMSAEATGFSSSINYQIQDSVQTQEEKFQQAVKENRVSDIEIGRFKSYHMLFSVFDIRNNVRDDKLFRGLFLEKRSIARYLTKDIVNEYSFGSIKEIRDKLAEDVEYNFSLQENFIQDVISYLHSDQDINFINEVQRRELQELIMRDFWGSIRYSYRVYYYIKNELNDENSLSRIPSKKKAYAKKINLV